MDLVTLLATIADSGPVSGEALAARMGCSRTAIWKGVKQLREEGLEVVADRGYRLVDPAGWGPTTLSWRTGRAVEHHESCPSTNDLARERARGLSGREPVAELPLIVADHQSSGRGRLGRRWEARPGENLLFSAVMRPDLPPEQAPRCLLLWAAAMAEALDLWLKWPNDLVSADGHKVAGVLAELEVRAEPFGRDSQLVHIVLGVGVNVRQQEFPGLPGATSLARLGRDTRDRAALLGRLIRALDAVDPRASLDAWRARSRTLGRRVRVAGLEGVATGVREDGALLVDGEPVLAGDVEMVRPTDAPGETDR